MSETAPTINPACETSCSLIRQCSKALEALEGAASWSRLPSVKSRQPALAEEIANRRAQIEEQRTELPQNCRGPRKSPASVSACVSPALEKVDVDTRVQGIASTILWSSSVGRRR